MSKSGFISISLETKNSKLTEISNNTLAYSTSENVLLLLISPTVIFGLKTKQTWTTKQHQNFLQHYHRNHHHPPPHRNDHHHGR